MRNTYLQFFAIVTLLSVCTVASQTQPGTLVRNVHKDYVDSLKQVKYDYKFPIWGQKAYDRGIDLAYPAGAMVNYIWMNQGIVIDNFQLGFKNDQTDIPLTDMDMIQFENSQNTSYGINVRPDLWVLPFLNVYGIFGYAHLKTEVNLVYPVKLTSVVEQGASTAGFGLMSGFAVGGFFMSVDANFTWNKPELLEKAVPVNVLGLRLGKNFKFKNNPSRNLTFWAGGMRVNAKGVTSGQITISEALPGFVEKKDQIVSDYYNWYDNEATPAEKIVADKVLTPVIENIDKANGNGTVRYAMDKNLKELWNGIIGAQFQYNKNWQLRSEAGIIGDRKSFLISLNYRFLL
ncbi:hypothetical protein K8352_02105 [Flavobacteriaceae bacterium F89]|uniref:Uncharacterized protein n=1 Tax=Cerina litoralis TaxID=2874477 RepID=A0AAE3ETK1_9FLAO|nr:hypothetical protein [Cerina litoralis]MCG2459536.1 hypothetical protein [Cerina litoralis]